MTEINKLDVGAFLDSLKSFRDQVDDKEAFDLMVGKAEQLKDPSTTIDIEHPAVSVPGATTTQLARSSPSDEPTAKKVAAPPKKSPPPSSTSTDDDTTSTTPTSSTPPPVKKADDPVAVLTEMQMKTVEALNKLAGLVGEAMKKSAFPAQQANDPLSELNAILGSHSGKMPLSEDPVIKALEGDDMYSFSRALAAAGGDDDKNKFKKANATNEVFTKLRQATIDELTARGFTASLMSDSHWRPLPPPP